MTQFLQIGSRDMIIRLEPKSFQIALLCLHQFPVDVQHGAQIHMARRLLYEKSRIKLRLYNLT